MLAFVIATVDILPVLGVGTVLLPWTAGLLLAGNGTKALEIAVIYLVITVVRQIAEPRIVGSVTGLHPVLTLMCMYSGLRLAGAAGMIVFPIAAALALKLSQAFSHDGGAKTESRHEKTRAPIKFRLHPFAFFGFAVSLAAMPTSCFAALAVSAVLHECGHLTAAALLGRAPREITVLPIGISIDYGAAGSYRDICLAALAGPFLNLLTAAMACVLPLSSDFAAYAVAFSLSLAAMNLIPLSFSTAARRSVPCLPCASA